MVKRETDMRDIFLIHVVHVKFASYFRCSLYRDKRISFTQPVFSDRSRSTVRFVFVRMLTMGTNSCGDVCYGKRVLVDANSNNKVNEQLNEAIQRPDFESAFPT